MKSCYEYCLIGGQPVYTKDDLYLYFLEDIPHHFEGEKKKKYLKIRFTTRERSDTLTIDFLIVILHKRA